MPYSLTKSDYMLYLKHPAWLWLKVHDKAKLPPVSASTQAIFDAGHAFESYAESLFPGGIKLGFSDYKQYLSLPARTQDALNSGSGTIFQGRFEADGLTFICDVLTLRENKVVDLCEIKSGTKVKDDHLYDLAFQMIVLERCGYTVDKIMVAHVNSDYVRQGDIQSSKLVMVEDVSERVKIMVKREFHTARTQTPFADEAKYSARASYMLKLCLAHNIKDIGELKTVDEQLLDKLLRNGLTVEQYNAAMVELAELDPAEEMLRNNKRLIR